MTIKPLNGRVLVQLLDSEKITAGGIILPDSAVKQSQRGLVLAAEDWVATDGSLQKRTVKPNDIVLVPKYFGEGIRVDTIREEIAIYRQEDLLAVIETEAESEMRLAS